MQDPAPTPDAHVRWTILDHPKEFRRIVVHVFLKRVLTERRPEIPVDDLFSGLRKPGLTMRVVRLVHQTVLT